MHVVGKRFYFAIAMNKPTIIKVHNVTESALTVKRLGLNLVPLGKFILEFLNNLMTVSILADMSRSFAWIPTTSLSELKLMLRRIVPLSFTDTGVVLDSDSNELSRSWVGRENQGYKSSQSLITIDFTVMLNFAPTRSGMRFVAGTAQRPESVSGRRGPCPVYRAR